MAIVQSEYKRTHDKWQNGQLVNPLVSRVDSYEAELTGDDKNVAFGVVVQRSAVKDTAAKKGGTQATGILGITVKDPTRGQQRQQGDGYAVGSEMGVISFGDIAVKVESAVTAGSDVTFDSVTGELSTQTVGAAQPRIKGATWMEDAAAGANAVVRIPPSFEIEIA